MILRLHDKEPLDNWVRHAGYRREGGLVRDTGTLTGGKGVGEGHRYTYRKEGGLVRNTGTLTGGKGGW